jgi:hypothetical protein
MQQQQTATPPWHEHTTHTILLLLHSYILQRYNWFCDKHDDTLQLLRRRRKRNMNMTAPYADGGRKGGSQRQLGIIQGDQEMAVNNRPDSTPVICCVELRWVSYLLPLYERTVAAEYLFFSSELYLPMLEEEGTRREEGSVAKIFSFFLQFPLRYIALAAS